MDGNINPFLDPNWIPNCPLIDFCEQNEVGEDLGGAEEEEQGAVGGVPRVYPPPRIHDCDRESDFRVGGPLANQAGRVLMDKEEELYVIAENKRLRQQAQAEHNRMLAVQEEKRQLAEAASREIETLKAKLHGLGLDTSLEQDSKSTPGGIQRPAAARRAINFTEKFAEKPLTFPHTKADPSNKTFVKTNPQQSTFPPPKYMREDINAFTASGGTEYRDLPPLNHQNKNWQRPGADVGDNRIRNDQYHNSPSRNRNSDQFGPQFLSTHRHSDGQNRGRKSWSSFYE